MTTSVQTDAAPAWQVATLFPNQGQWGEGDYLDLTHITNRLVEFSNGCIEILPTPKTSHQLIVQYLSNLLLRFVTPRQLGVALFAPLRVRLAQGAFREPDVVFMAAENAGRMGEDYWDGADLVMEVVSDENRNHDFVTKRAEYAAARIPEYWIIDARDKRVLVLTLRGASYECHIEAVPGQLADSLILPGFNVDVTAVFQAAAASGGTA